MKTQIMGLLGIYFAFILELLMIFKDFLQLLYKVYIKH